jgi:FKBP-type peptidyl-prolyl cis-trans isomerase 2
MSRRKIIATMVTNRKKKLERTNMKEMAKRFVGKECIIYYYDGNQLTGVIKEISGGAALVERNEALEAINLDFVSRIREYPKGKNGKKKSVVIN